MKRWIFFAAGLVLVALAAGGYYVFGFAESKRPIVVGLLHSQTGPLAASEKPMFDAEVLALEEINAKGGILGRPVKWVIADGRSDPTAFAQQAQRLITIDKVNVIFGCYASHCRKAVKPVVEESNHLLIYPAAYEGVEQSPNIVYTGGPANQQVTPAVSWCFDTLKARKYFLIGSDTVWAHVVDALATDVLKAREAQIVGEEYLLPDATDVSGAIDKIKQAGPDVVLSTLEGETNAAFYAGLTRAGIKPERTPVVSFIITEEELRTLPLKDVVGHYSAWNYFQSLDRAENVEFVRKFKARYGQDRVTNDGATTGYNSVQLWAQAVLDAGTEQVAEVRKAIRRQSLDAPEAVVTVDFENLHNWRPFYLGKVRPDGQFEVVYALTKPIPPVPFPETRPRKDWESLIETLPAGWGGHWANPARAAPERR